jgi:hypothetical protein
MFALVAEPRKGNIAELHRVEEPIIPMEKESIN